MASTVAAQSEWEHAIGVIYAGLKWVQLERDLAFAYPFFRPFFREPRHRASFVTVAQWDPNVLRLIGSFLVAPGLDLASLTQTVRWARPWWVRVFCCCCLTSPENIAFSLCRAFPSFELGRASLGVGHIWPQTGMSYGSWYNMCAAHRWAARGVMRHFGLDFARMKRLPPD